MTHPSSGIMDPNDLSGRILLDLDPQVALDFDYEALFQDADFDYRADDSSSNSATLLDAPPPPVAPAPTVVEPRSSVMRQRLERRGHTKSRRGCFNCKRRRIKVKHDPIIF